MTTLRHLDDYYDCDDDQNYHDDDGFQRQHRLGRNIYQESAKNFKTTA